MIRKPKWRGERGQTIVLIAISMVSLLAMAALAIDVVTLYLASSEIKLAADAAALAGAKAIADSGATTLATTDSHYADAQTLAQTMANAAITTVLQANMVAGAVPTQASGSPQFTWTNQGNPTVKVSLQRTNLPTFFSKIWGRTSSLASASATAEVYNPSNNAPYTPIAPTSVKPWLVANFDPTNGGANFVSSTNATETGGAIGRTFDLTADCSQSGNPPNCNATSPMTFQSAPVPWVQYVPACVAGMPCNSSGNYANNVCPSSAGGEPYYFQAIICADFGTTYTFPDAPYGCGLSANWDPSTNPTQNGINSLTATETEALINGNQGSVGPGQGQDSIIYPTPFQAAFQITPGYNNPGQFFGTGLVSTSTSIVTIPIIAPTVNQSNPAVTVVGFMQAFINSVQAGGSLGVQPGDINITVLNISGCNGTSNGNPPVVGGTGTSPVPVRLINP
jgi:Flp pilus assembly protein TadG